MSRILVTGAGGFLGRACVAAARAQGFEVIALVRRAGVAAWDDDPGVKVLRLDLSDGSHLDPLRRAVGEADAVIHAAAHLGGDRRAMTADTVRGTETLLAAMAGQAARLVLVSSVAVYDTMRLSPGETLDEDAPLEHPDRARDAYAEGKLRQETLVRATGREAWLMRLGMVYGPGRSWPALMGFGGKAHVQIGSEGTLPLVHVEHCARALVQAALTPVAGVQALNVIDDDLPTRARFLAAHRRLAGWPKLVLPVPFDAWLGLARTLRPVSGRLPGLFREPILRARLMPLRYPNARLREALGGHDAAPFETMLARSLSEGGS